MEVQGAGIAMAAKTLPGHPEDSARFPFLVSWIFPLIRTAHERPLDEADVWACPKSQCVEADTAMFWESWREEVQEASKIKSKPSLTRGLLRAFRADIMAGSVKQFFFMITQIAQPYLVGELVQFTATSNGGINYGVALAIGLAVVSVVSSTSLSASLFSSRKLGIAVRSALMMAVYEHGLQLTASSRAKMTTGTITSLVAIDCEKLFQAALFGHFAWHGPIASIIVVCLLIREIGWAPALCLFGFIVVLVPLQNQLALIIGRARQRMIKRTDERVKLTSEILTAIRAIKVYSWEIPMGSRVLAVRGEELKHLGEYLLSNTNLRELLFMALPFMGIIVFSFIVYHSRLPLSVPLVFRVLSFVNILRFPLNLLGQALKGFTDAFVALERLERFFSLPSIPPTSPFSSESVGCVIGEGEEQQHPKNPRVSITSPTSFSWSAEGDEGTECPPPSFCLRDIVFNAPPPSSPHCRLVAVVGAVGAGKSTFLSSILGETTVLGGGGGGAHVQGGVAYCAQTPWILNQTLKKNILFGASLTAAGGGGEQHTWYREALESAALLPDLEVLPAGDETEIGERGINLSGGQKQRVSLARAFFAARSGRAQVLVLDDPFSAVDATSAQFIFEFGLLRLSHPERFPPPAPHPLPQPQPQPQPQSQPKPQEEGKGQRGASLILCALNSHLHLLAAFDKVVLLDKGEIVFDASLDEDAWKSHRSLLLAAGIPEGLGGGRGCDALPPSLPPSLPPPLPPLSQPQPQPQHDDEPQSKGHGQGHGQGQGQGLDAGAVKTRGTESETEAAAPAQLIKTEHRGVGSVSWTTYLAYFAAGFSPSFSLTGLYEKPTPSVAEMSLESTLKGGLILLGTLLIFSAAQVARLSIDYSLAQWAGQAQGDPGSGWAVVYYSAFALCFFLCVVRGLYLNAFAVLSAAKINAVIFARILQAPVNTFFDRTSTGEVLNKMSRDTETIDVSVPEFLLQFLINWLYVGSIFGLCIWATPWLLILLCPTLFAFFRLFQYFASASRDLKRMESVTRSPVYSSLSESMAGMETIRAYRANARFLATHREKMDRNQKHFWHLWMSTSWMTTRLEVSTSFVLFAVAILCVCLRETSSPIALGLSLSYGLQLTALFQRCLQLSIDVSTYMISVERILHYNSLQSELNVVLPPPSPAAPAPASALVAAPGDHEEGEGRDGSSEGGGGDIATSQYTLLPSSPSLPALAQDWPMHGAIVFQSVGLRYRHNTPQVLDSLSFSIAGGEMVGVVGRTGAGKSSILVCLFRMVEIFKGAIFIDGVNIQSVPLRRLRAAIASIPQDPVLLSGTLRFQLDPCLQYSDVEVCEALSMVGMLDFVRVQRLGLDELVQEGGECLSHGQRQLLCIARALLRKAKILVIDEGTVRCSLLLFCKPSPYLTPPRLSFPLSPPSIQQQTRSCKPPSILWSSEPTARSSPSPTGSVP